MELENFDDEHEKKPIRGKEISNLLFKLPQIDDPLIGEPREIQEDLDNAVMTIQNNLDSSLAQHTFERIHVYMHGYLLNVVLKQFPYIKGYETIDIYQEALIAVRFKAIPNFSDDKGMSFLNFAKMCIRRHLITKLNMSKKRLKDQPMNQSISLDRKVSDENDDGDANTFFNLFGDDVLSADDITANKEAYDITLDLLKSVLSDFEKDVLDEWLSSWSYKDIAKNLSKRENKKYHAKSVDNALLRIRKKALQLRENCENDDLPMFIT